MWLAFLVFYGLLGLSLLGVQPREVNPEVVNYFRLSLFLASAVVIMITRPLVPVVRNTPSARLRKVLAYLLLSPAALIPAAGVLLAYFSGNWEEFLAFLVLGGFHLFRFSQPLREAAR